MSKRLTFFFLSVGCFFLFIVFTYLVHKNLFTHFDFNTTVRLQDHIGRNWDREFSWFSELGSFEVMLVFLIVLLLLSRKWLAGFIAFILFGCFHVIEIFGKYMVDHPPPPHFMLRTKNMVDFPQFHVSADFSYPSGHAGRSAFISVIIFTLIWQSKRLPLWAKGFLSLVVLGYDSTMVISRVTLGEHWTSDVIGGALLGCSLGLLVSIFLVGKIHFKKASSKHIAKQTSETK
jgi:membrane-associated phospholipid phosphatase